ncbi:PREDICTED: extensin [Tarenaya hassleriana]|uniref:extensin n=1 Tax=Tarenaya hassleriana TaxID=28532 RepID=UPI00053C95A5|nr:PREDICTED: extensin [Tarenaya hassleriana]
MASGSSGRVNSGSKGFDFGSDDILCSYEDYGNQDSSNGPHSDPAIGATNPNKEFNKTRMARSSVFPSSSYSPPEESLSQDITATVERTMKKYADNMMRFLEGISSRLSQLELYCYNLDKTIGEMRSDLTRENQEADVKLRSLDKHLQEVHRSVQILRDKQELAETQKELAKLQHGHKESPSSSHSQSGEERTQAPVADSKPCERKSDTHNQQLALALPHQVAPQPQPQLQPQPQAQMQPQQQYYTPPATHLSNLPAPAPAPSPAPAPAPALAPAPVPVPAPQPQPLAAQGQFVSPQPAPSQSSSAQPFSQYQQIWQPPQQQVRPQSSGPYPTYSPAPASNRPPIEIQPSSMPMQPSYSGPPPQTMQAYGYNPPAARTAVPPQQMKTSYSPQSGEGYVPSGYAMYEGGEAGRMQYPPPQQTHFPPGGYAPQQGGRQFLRASSAYGELIEKLVSMGFRGDHVMAVIQRMEESGQPIDFNAVLDRLSVQSPQRGW